MKKFIMIITVLALCLGLSACGGGEAPQPTAAPAAESTVEPSPTPEPTPTPPVLENYDLSGSWYGYWEMFSCTEAWAEMEGYRWDGCAEVSEDAMLLWDMDVPKEYGLGRLELEEGEPLSVIKGGSFMDNDIGSDQWSLKLKQDEYGRIMTIRGNYLSERNGNFSFVFYLRPWGESWPEGEGPMFYEEVFKPLMEQGEEMPENIFEEIA